MKDWNHDDEPPSLALRIEAIALLLAWAAGILLVIVTMYASFHA